LDSGLELKVYSSRIGQNIIPVVKLSIDYTYIFR
jgi:hypothetical protein